MVEDVMYVSMSYPPGFIGIDDCVVIICGCIPNLHVYHSLSARGFFLACINDIGTFDPEVPIDMEAAASAGSPEENILDKVKKSLQAALQKAVLYTAFYFTKRPQRIKQVREGDGFDGWMDRHV